MILELDIILGIGLSKRKERKKKKSTGTWDVFLMLQTLWGLGGDTNGHWCGNWVMSLRGFVGKLKKWQIKFDMCIKNVKKI